MPTGLMACRAVTWIPSSLPRRCLRSACYLGTESGDRLQSWAEAPTVTQGRGRDMEVAKNLPLGSEAGGEFHHILKLGLPETSFSLREGLLVPAPLLGPPFS